MRQDLSPWESTDRASQKPGSSETVFSTSPPAPPPTARVQTKPTPQSTTLVPVLPGNIDPIVDYIRTHLGRHYPVGQAGTSVTYSFQPSSDWTMEEQAAMRQALRVWSAVADLTFREVSGPAQIVFARTPGTGGAHTTPQGVIEIDTDVRGWNDLKTIGGYGFETLLHEIGHALGLSHPGPYDASQYPGGIVPPEAAIFPNDTRQASVMSYWDPEDSHRSSANFYNSEPSTPMVADILAAQQIYGPASRQVWNREVVGFHPGYAYLYSGTGPFVSGPDLAPYDLYLDTQPVFTILNRAANITLDVSGYSLPDVIDLRPGHYSSIDGMVGNIGLAFDAKLQQVIGSIGGNVFWMADYSATVVGSRDGYDVVHIERLRSQCTITNYTSGKIVVSVEGVPITYSLWGADLIQFADASVTLGDLPAVAATTTSNYVGDATAHDVVFDLDTSIVTYGLGSVAKYQASYIQTLTGDNIALGTSGPDEFRACAPAGDWTIWGRGGTDTLDLTAYLRNEVAVTDGGSELTVQLSQSTIHAHDIAVLQFMDGALYSHGASSSLASYDWLGTIPSNVAIAAAEFEVALGHGPDSFDLHKWNDYAHYLANNVSASQSNSWHDAFAKELAAELMRDPNFLYSGAPNDQFFDAASVAALGHTLPAEKAAWMATLGGQGNEGRAAFIASLALRPETSAHLNETLWANGIVIA